MQAMAEGLLTEDMLDASVRRLLRPHFQIGLFDPTEGQPFLHYNWSHVGSPDHRQLALEAARQSIVLLQVRRPRDPSRTRSRMRSPRALGFCCSSLARVLPPAAASGCRRRRRRCRRRWSLLPDGVLPDCLLPDCLLPDGPPAPQNPTVGGGAVLPLAAGARVVVAGPLWDGSGNMLGNYVKKQKATRDALPTQSDRNRFCPSRSV